MKTTNKTTKKTRAVYLSDETMRIARLAGDGNQSKGISIAIDKWHRLYTQEQSFFTALDKIEGVKSELHQN